MGQTLLVADDSKTMRQIMAMAFKGTSYRVIAVGSGTEALQAAYEHRPSIIVLDYHLPDRSGLDVCRAIKGDPSLREIPVLMMGGRYHPFSKEEALQQGSDGVIMKPFKTDEIHQQVRALVGGSVASAASASAPVPMMAAPVPVPVPVPTPRVPAPPQRMSSPTPRVPVPAPRVPTPPSSLPTPQHIPTPAAHQRLPTSSQRIVTALPPAPGQFGHAAPVAAAASATSLTREVPAPGLPATPGIPATAARHTAPTANQARYTSRLPASGGGAGGGSKLPPPSRYPGSRAAPVVPPTPAVAPSPMVTPAPPGVATPLSSPSMAAVQAPVVSFDREEMRSMVRDEVQAAVRAEMLTMVKNVLGDLFKERMMPKLLSYGQERIEAIVARDLQDIMERRVEEELAKLTNE